MMFMDIKEYFDLLDKDFKKSYDVAAAARAKGCDPEEYVEIKPAPDLASRVEGIIGIDGLADIIRKHNIDSRQELAFKVVKEITSAESFANANDKKSRLTLAVRIGLAILTEGILVAPTEGLQGIELHKNNDGTDYISVLYAGPIRGAGGTSAALSVALADYARKQMGISNYKAQQKEIERYLEEIQIYNSRVARLQYLPGEEDMRVILENCPVCIDGLPTEDLEVSIHRNIMRLDADGKEQLISNRIRSGVCLVSCEGIAQKAKSVLKYTKNAGLDWSWLNNIIKVDKGASQKGQQEKKEAVFLHELVAGRPVFAYPEYRGAFRLRYGRSRLTGIAAKGFSPATMILLDEFIVTGTQLKVEKPGKGCVAMPVDSIEGPFVKLKSGRAFRINTAHEARKYMPEISKILSVGDMLVTYGDFKKTNTPLSPTSYVEEYWYEQLKEKGYKGDMPKDISFKDALSFSTEFSVPMHPRYIYDYYYSSKEAMALLMKSVAEAAKHFDGKSLFSVDKIELHSKVEGSREALEAICAPHYDHDDYIEVYGDDAQSMIATFGFLKDDLVDTKHVQPEGQTDALTILDMLNAIAPFKIMKRSTGIGGRMGRPEKARERLMRPAPNVLFPVGEYGGKERSISKAYIQESKNLGSSGMEVEIARYRCLKNGEYRNSVYCNEHHCRTFIERKCKACGNLTKSKTCEKCGSPAYASEMKRISIVEISNAAMKNLGMQTMPKLVKGVKGLFSANKVSEPLEKGILRSMRGVYIFKDGTARFDATDVPMTHFYPNEVKTSVEALRKLGYTKDYQGNDLNDGNQLVELMHQDVILNARGAEYMLKVTKFIDDLLVKYYRMEPFYNAASQGDLVGHLVMSLSPHTSAGVLGRIIGFTDANVGFAHPYVISARRRNCDGDEDTTMMLLDGLINFSRQYLPSTIGGTMDAPLILTVNVKPEEVDDEVHVMEVIPNFTKAFYDKTYDYPQPGEVSMELVGSRLNSDAIYKDILFTHSSSASAVADSPIQSSYTKLKTMHDKIKVQFELMDKLYSIDKRDTARRLILSHFIPDLMGNLHSFSRQTFRCVACNAKYRRVPLMGKCTRCGGKLLLTISKGGIEKYLDMAITLADRYDLETYIKQRIMLLKEEIIDVFGGIGSEITTNQFSLAKFI